VLDAVQRLGDLQARVEEAASARERAGADRPAMVERERTLAAELRERDGALGAAGAARALAPPRPHRAPRPPRPAHPPAPPAPERARDPPGRPAARAGRARRPPGRAGDRAL